MIKVKNIIMLAILILGFSGVLALSFNQLKLLARLQGTGTVPIPLVFDAPLGYEFWANTNHYEIITNIEKFDNLVFDRKAYQKFPTHSILHNSILIPITMFPVLPNSQNQMFMKSVFCDSNLWHFFLPRIPFKEEHVLFFKLKIVQKEKIWEINIPCK